jgi:hypothetical protein
VKKRTTINVLTMLLVMLFEYIVIEWTRAYGSNTDMVSHVGFAGTIVSIVLAVVAIIYSYYQNFAQRRDSALLGQQLESLRTVAASLSREGTDLGAIKDQIRQTLDSATRTELSVQELGARVAATKAASGEDAEFVQSQSNASRADLPISSPANMVNFLLKSAGRPQQTVYLALSAAVEKNLSTTELGSLVRRAVEKRLVEQGKTNIVPALTNWCEGTVAGTSWLLEDLGILIRRDDEGTGVRRFRAIPEFLKGVKEMKPLAARPDLLLTPDAIAPEIAALS